MLLCWLPHNVFHEINEKQVKERYFITKGIKYFSRELGTLQIYEKTTFYDRDDVGEEGCGALYKLYRK
jgi:hypothetical protein